MDGLTRDLSGLPGSVLAQLAGDGSVDEAEARRIGAYEEAKRGLQTALSLLELGFDDDSLTPGLWRASAGIAEQVGACLSEWRDGGRQAPSPTMLR